MLYISLEVPLAFLDISGLHESHDFCRARIEIFHKSFDITSLPCRITSLEDDEEFLSALSDILLELRELELEREHLFFIGDI